MLARGRVGGARSWTDLPDHDRVAPISGPWRLKNEQIDFGFKIRTERMPAGSPTGELPFSDLFNAVRDAALPDGRLAFRKVEEDSFVPADDVAVLDTEFPVVGSISLTNGETLAPY